MKDLKRFTKAACCNYDKTSGRCLGVQRGEALDTIDGPCIVDKGTGACKYFEQCVLQSIKARFPACEFKQNAYYEHAVREQYQAMVDSVAHDRADPIPQGIVGPVSGPSVGGKSNK